MLVERRHLRIKNRLVEKCVILNFVTFVVEDEIIYP